MANVRGMWLLLVTLPVLAAGCRGSTVSADSRASIDLKDIHEMYMHFIKSQEKPPAQLSDLAKKEYEGIYPAAVNGLRQGKYVVLWGVKDKAAATPLAYEKDVPNQGGAVVMADGSVRAMTPDQFKAAGKS
jgi:hypothetical protein